jgi:diguanylate cyclase
MAAHHENIRRVYFEHLDEFYRHCPPGNLELIRQAVFPAAAQIAAHFYEHMMQREAAHHFLSNELVQQRLLASMTKWVQDVFAERHSREEVASFVDYQLLIGQVHARIDLPPHLLNEGVRELKQDVARRLQDRDIPAATLVQVTQQVHLLLDIVAALMNESYFSNMVSTERQSQSMQSQLIGSDVAIQCERLRAGLFDWLRRVVMLVYQQERGDISKLPRLKHSDFGLWVAHKAEMFFFNSPEVAEMRLLIEQADELLETMVAAHHQQDRQTFDTALEQLNETVSKASWQLSSLVDHCLHTDNARDPLTKLLSRRFLDAVLQKETSYSIRNGLNYALLMVDLDHFKQINDTYGHETGDRILAEAAELLQANIRAGDFLFRYGGEEFLVVVTDINELGAVRVAKKILAQFNQHAFSLGKAGTLTVTASIGLALHKGHPDYGLVVKDADAALYRAKAEGRNRYVLAG